MGQSGPGSDSSEGELHIPQSSSITGTSPSDCLVSYLGHSLEETYPSTEIQSVYAAALADWDSSGGQYPSAEVLSYFIVSTDNPLKWSFEL